MNSTAIRPTEPFVDPLNRNLIRIPGPRDKGILATAKVAHQQNKDKNNDMGIKKDGVKFDFENFQFVVDVRKLDHQELKGRIRLLVSDDEAFEFYAGHDYNISAQLNDTAYVQVRELSAEVSDLEDGFKEDPFQYIRRKLFERYMDEGTKYEKIYRSFEKILKELPPLVSRNKAIDFSKLYPLEHSELNPRQYKFTALSLEKEDEMKASVAQPARLGPEELKSFTVHGCVIEINGGNLKAAFTSGYREQVEKEIQIRVSNPEVMDKFIQYLYGKQITPANDLEARDLYQLANQWEIEPLRELCWLDVVYEDIKDISPEKLLTPDQFKDTLGNSETEMIRAAAKATEQVKFFFERLKPHITEATKRSESIT